MTYEYSAYDKRNRALELALELAKINGGPLDADQLVENAEKIEYYTSGQKESDETTENTRKFTIPDPAPYEPSPPFQPWRGPWFAPAQYPTYPQVWCTSTASATKPSGQEVTYNFWVGQPDDDDIDPEDDVVSAP